MAEQAKAKRGRQAIRIVGQEHVDTNCELVLVKGGPRAYLWIGSDDRGCLAHISGPAALRALARAILNEIPAPRKRARRQHAK